MKLHLPPVVRIEPAASCNLRCLHCPTGLGKSPKGIMSNAIFKLILEELRKYGDEVNTVVLYHGGEPLLNPNLYSMISEIGSTKVKKTKLVTNGKLLDSVACELLCKSGLNEIEISLDSVSKKDSDSIRRRSDALSTIQNVKHLRRVILENRSHLIIRISTTQFVDDYGITSLDQLEKATPPEWLKEDFPDLEIKSTWAILWPGGYPEKSNVAFADSVKTIPEKCSLLDETITVRTNGDVVVCCYDLTGLSNLGNVSQNPLSEIWNSLQYSDFRQSFKNGNYAEPCKSCSVVTGPQFISKSELLSSIRQNS